MRRCVLVMLLQGRLRREYAIAPLAPVGAMDQYHVLIVFRAAFERDVARLTSGVVHGTEVMAK